MGIGRRAFLKFVATALGSLAVDPLQVVAVRGDYYVNGRLGLGFVKPRTWFLAAFRDFAAELKGQIIRSLGSDALEEKFRRDQTSTLVATIYKYGRDVRRFGPSITVFKNQEDYPYARSVGLERLTQSATAMFGLLLKDYAVLEAPSRCEMSCCPAIRFKARWVFEHCYIQPILIEDETWVIDQGTQLYTIHLYDSPDAGETASEEFARFLESLHIL